MLSDRRGKGLAARSLNPLFFACKLQAGGAAAPGVRLSDGGGPWGQPGAGVTVTAVDS